MKKGFTLIELLVVISIIVVLASIVLVGVRSAINKAKDARIVSAMSQFQTQAEMIRQENSDQYTLLNTNCGVNAQTETLCEDIARQLGKSMGDATAIAAATSSIGAGIFANASQFCMIVPLNSQFNGAQDYYCLDSTGQKGQTVTATGTQATNSCYVNAGTIGTCKGLR